MLLLYDIEKRHWKRWQALAGQCQSSLTAQQISLDGPGTILKDVNALLDFVGPQGIVTKGRNGTLPIDALPELNRRASYPIQLRLKRALLRDYPNLAGTFVLLRVLELLQMKGSRLVVCPSALGFWRGLNPTEQYFALLEALLFHAQSSVLGGERTREEPQAFRTIAVFLGQLSDRWRNFDQYESARPLGPQGELPPWNLFVQQQLGLIEIRPRSHSEQQRRDWGGRGWLIGGARLTPWGTAITWALLELWQREVAEEDEEAGDESDPGEGKPQLDFEMGIFSTASDLPANDRTDDADEHNAGGDALANEMEESADDSAAEPQFGGLQEVFQPYFPELLTAYARPNREVRSGSHIFKVTLGGWRGGGGGIWRRIAVPPEASLDSLAGAILRAFKLDEDHLYDFRYRDQRGKSRVYNHPYTDEGPFTPEILVGETELAVKDEMRFTFDYGDYWEFAVRLEKIEDGPSQLLSPKVVESAGTPPPQYPPYEE